MDNTEFVQLTNADTKKPIFLKKSAIECFSAGSDTGTYVHMANRSSHLVLEEADKVLDMICGENRKTSAESPEPRGQNGKSWAKCESWTQEFERYMRLVRDYAEKYLNWDMGGKRLRITMAVPMQAIEHEAPNLVALVDKAKMRKAISAAYAGLPVIEFSTTGGSTSTLRGTLNGLDSMGIEGNNELYKAGKAWERANIEKCLGSCDADDELGIRAHYFLADVDTPEYKEILQWYIDYGHSIPEGD